VTSRADADDGADEAGAASSAPHRWIKEKLFKKELRSLL